MTLIKLSINWKDQVKFDQLTKKSFDQTPNLTETFDQLKMSSEIQSSDHSPENFDKDAINNQLRYIYNLPFL